MAETSQTVLIERPEPGVAVLRLNRPQRSNAMEAAVELENRAQVLGLQNADFAQAARDFVRKSAKKAPVG